jgi:5-methylcytosine-specific restriction endonuclease McrA
MGSKDSKSTFCTVDGCGKARRARMLCASHYNAVHRKPNPTAEFNCDSCGAVMVKERSRANRYSSLYCSELCRNYALWGGCSSDIPSSHWARWYGSTSVWAAPAAIENGPCGWCGGVNQRTRSSTFCSYRCKKAQYKATRRGREHNASGTYTWMDITRLWQVFDRACAYCHTPTPLAEIQAEHVVALSNGGANNTTNLLPSCAACNSDKRDLPLEAWNADRARRGLDARCTAWSMDDTRYRHLTSVHALVA